MGQVLAAGPSVPAAPPLAPPPPMAAPGTGPSTGPQTSTSADKPPEIPQDTGPGTFEELHKKCKGIKITHKFPN